EVWQRKRLAQKETQHLRGAEYFAYVRQRVTDAYPFPLRHVCLTPDEPAANVMMVSDGHGAYRTKRRVRGKG
ncbi:MAG: hypothetical protein NTV22_07070, partial [bacterium]|nr:hypothetical protein [bacterium]